MNVGLTHVPFGRDSLHRYNTADKITIQQTFDNCRMVKQNTLQIDINSISYDDLFSYNFGYYQFDSTAKKFYFFVLDIEYINDITASIDIEIDWFTTDFKPTLLAPSFVERIHPSNYDDDFTQIAEGLNYEPKQYNIYEFINHTIDKYVIGVTHAIPENELVDVGKMGETTTPFVAWHDIPKLCGIPQGCVYYYLDSIDECITVYQNAVNFGYTSAVTGVYGVTSEIVGQDYKLGKGVWYPMGVYIKSTKQEFAPYILNETNELKNVQEKTIELGTAIVDNTGTYIPKYKKCFADEFIEFCVMSPNQTIFYKPSMCLTTENGRYLKFIEYASVDYNMNITIAPTNYGGVARADFSNALSENFAISGQLTADNTTNSILKLITANYRDTVTVAEQGLTGNYSGAVGTVAGDVINSLGYMTGYTHDTTTSITGTTQNAYQLPQIPANSRYFYFGTYGISVTSAKYIDNYFSMYGYAVNRAMQPYLRRESDYNYTYIRGNINLKTYFSNQSREYIQNLFQRGLTIWYENMYQYDVDN